VRTLLIDPTGRLWIGSTAGLSRYDGTKFRNWTKGNGLADNDILALAGTNDGCLWAATKDGLDCFEAGRFTEVLRGMRILDLYVDREQNVWIGRGGLLRLDSSRPEFARSQSGEPVRGRYDLMQTRDGAIWAGTTTGLVHYKDDIAETYSTKHGLVDEHVLCLLQDSHGGIWIGTEGGVNHFDGKQFTSLTVQDGLSSPHVTALVEDSAGQIWMGTAAGVTIYDPNRTVEHAGDQAGECCHERAGCAARRRCNLNLR
jgi:ligand-binding sensor domain-containing protein